MRRRTGERLYSLLLRFYPSAFRRRFGPDMREYFGDELERRRRESGRAGVAKLWLGTIIDTAVHAAAEWRSAWTSARREPPRTPGSDMTRLTWNLMDHVRLDVRAIPRARRFRFTTSCIGVSRGCPAWGRGRYNILPLSGGYSCDGFRIDRRSVARGQEPCAEARSISPRFFEVMGTLVRPRVLGGGRQRRSPRRSSINQGDGRQFWPGEDPVGQTITYFSRGDQRPAGNRRGRGGYQTSHADRTAQADVLYATAAAAVLSRHDAGDPRRGGRGGAHSAVRHEVRQMDSRIALYNIRTLDQLLGRSPPPDSEASCSPSLRSSPWRSRSWGCMA